MQFDNTMTCSACGTEYDGNTFIQCPECHYPIFFLSPWEENTSEAMESYMKQMGVSPQKFFIQEGDTFEYGTYQNKTIQWKVLKTSARKALLLSEYALDVQPYNKQKAETTWEKSSLRNWLNNTFFQEAFSENEQSNILKTQRKAEHNFDYMSSGGNDTEDFVFLLNLSEAKEYAEYGLCKPTSYARRKNPFSEPGTPYCSWWLSCPGSNESNSVYVTTMGTPYVKGNSVNSNFISVRPAMWIHL